MKYSIKGISLAALAFATVAGAGVAYAAADHMGDKTITRAEAQTHAEEMFAHMDANKDGKLDTADRTAHQKEMFDRHDTNKDGSISREEFAAGHQRGPEGEGGPEAGAPPPDGRGMGGHRMGGMGMRGPGKHGGPGGMMMLQMADTNKDGAVSKQEFIAGATKHFEMADANKDGKVTAEERKAAHEKMRETMHTQGGKDMPPPPPAN